MNRLMMTRAVLAAFSLSLFSLAGCNGEMRARPMVTKLVRTVTPDDDAEDKVETEWKLSYAANRMDKIVRERDGEKQSTRELSYGAADELTKLVTESEPDDGEEEGDVSTAKYSWEDGKIVKVVSSTDGNFISSEAEGKYTYEGGKLTQQKTESTLSYESGGSDIEVTNSSEYDIEYDDNGRFSRLKGMNESKSTTDGESDGEADETDYDAKLTWNDDGQLEKTVATTTSESGEAETVNETTTTYEYDDEGRVESSKVNRVATLNGQVIEGSEQEQKTKLSYDGEGRVENVTVEEDDETTEYEYSYDDEDFEGDGVEVSPPLGGFFDLKGSVFPEFEVFFNPL